MSGWQEEERRMDFAPSGNGRMVVALLVLVTLAVLVWRTMEPGKFQNLSWILLGFFAFRVILTRVQSRRIESKPDSTIDDRQDVQ
jgi:hypothetical protein